jgi:short-subunit dehydrogenase involved in D-alanine esterification of teichoic acids
MYTSSSVPSKSIDTSDKQALNRFSVTKQYPDIDCVFINAGLQRPSDFASPETVNLAEFHQQMHINYTAAVSLVHAFLPFLLAKTGPTSVIL